MKRLVTFFLLSVLVLSASAQDNNIWFPLDVVQLESGDSKEYTQEIWYEGALPGGGHFYGALPFWEAYRDDYEYDAETISGDLQVTFVGYIENQKGVKVTFTGNRGAILISARNNGNFDGTQYSCSYVLYYGSSSKRWDFNTKPFTVVSDRWWGDETHMAGNNNHPIYTPYNGTLYNNGSYLINEADGLTFVTPEKSFGYHNPGVNHWVKNKKLQDVEDPTSDSNIETRFICFKAGSKLIIPASNFSNFTYPRVRIKMNRDGNNTLNLKINNACDAVGKEITGNYGIGGCSWWGYKDDAEHRNKFDYLYRGEYHFQIINKDQDFSIEVPTDNQANNWLMIYTIEVYDSEEMITENSILGDNYQFLTTRFIGESETVTAPAAFYVHYRGKGESSTVSNATVSGTVGTLGQKTYSSTPEVNKFLQRFASSVGTDTHHTYTPEPGEYGTFRIRLDVHDHTGNYVTDYAYRTMSCGLLENKAYPYTWDFTDIKTYQNSNFKDDKGVETLAANKMALESQSGYAEQPDNDYLHGVTYIPRNLWENGGLRVANEAGNYNVMFCDGSQLWYGNTIIPETAGLAFLPNNFDGLYNGAMTLTDGGLKMDQDQTSWWKWRIMVPQVDNTCTIYVRAKKLTKNYDGALQNFIIGYVYGDTGNKDPYSEFNTSAIDGTKKARLVATVDDDEIYAVPGPSSTQNVTLFFNGVEVHKIAVSTDPKKVNIYGWATESRDHVIDQELTSYFTGEQFEACLVDEVSYDNRKVKLSRPTLTSKVMKKSNGNDYSAYIIHNKGNKAVDILATDDGFHLFVPDIHDYLKSNESTYNQKSVNSYKETMKAQLAPGRVYATNDDGTTNFVLTYMVAEVDAQEQQGQASDFGKVGFFRVQYLGSNNYVESKGNQGYLPILLSSGSNKFDLVWSDDADGIDSIITDNSVNVNNNVFYNINGQKLNGIPTQRGIYIVNGKKVFVK